MSESPPPVRKRRLWLRLLVAVAVIAVLGILIFGAMLWSWTKVEHLDAAGAERAFAEARASAGGGPAYFEVPEHGDLVVHHELESDPPPRIRALHGLVWQANRQRFVRLDLPGWFVRAKLKTSTGVESFLRGHGWEPGSSREISAEDLAQLGHGLLLDVPVGEGSRILLWLEGEARP